LSQPYHQSSSMLAWDPVMSSSSDWFCTVPFTNSLFHLITPRQYNFKKKLYRIKNNYLSTSFYRLEVKENTWLVTLEAFSRIRASCYVPASVSSRFGVRARSLAAKKFETHVPCGQWREPQTSPQLLYCFLILLLLHVIKENRAEQLILVEDCVGCTKRCKAARMLGLVPAQSLKMPNLPMLHRRLIGIPALPPRGVFQLLQRWHRRCSVPETAPWFSGPSDSL